MSHARKRMLSFYLTTKCNLNCIYCYTDKYNHQHQTLDFDFAKTAIDEYIGKNKLSHIRFFGAGEPTVEFSLMTKITGYASEKVNDLKVEIQTNGVFNKSIANWLAKNIQIVWISIDGTPDIHDHYRQQKNGIGTSLEIEKNIKTLFEQGCEMVGMRMTITSRNLYKQIECIDYFKSLGVRYIWSDPIFPSVGESPSFYESFDLMEYAREFIDAVNYADSKGVFYGSILTCNFDEESKINCRACLPMPHLTTDGYVTSCDMALFGNDKDHMDVFIYGRWDPQKSIIEYDHDKIKNLQNRTIENLSECKNCEAKLFCAGYCLGEVQNETRSLYKRKERVCRPIQYLFKKLNPPIKKFDYLHP